MANPEQIEQELLTYLNEENFLSKEDRLKHLKAIYDKHFAMDQTTHVTSLLDLRKVVDDAKILYSNSTLPLNISKENAREQEINYVFVIESFIAYLNKNKLLKRLVRFDYTR